MIVQNKNKTKKITKTEVKPKNLFPLDYSLEEELDLYDMEEFFVAVDGFMHYLISNKGRLFKLNPGGKTKEVKTFKNQGNLIASLRRYDRSTTKSIKQLMLDTFGDECPLRFK